MLRRIPLYPFEWVTLAAATAAGVVLAYLQLPVSGDSVVHTLKTAAQLPIPFALGIMLYGYYYYAQGNELKPYLKQVFSVDWLLLWVRLWLACCVVSFFYFWIKVYVPLIHESDWDEAIWKLDRGLHLGYSPNEVAVRLLAETRLADWLDRWYAWWLATVIWFLAFYTASTDSLLRRRVVLSCLLLWISGATLYAILPVRGPVFAFGAIWANLPDSLPRAQEMQQLLSDNYQAVLATRQGGGALFDHRLGIAALPSLHVAFHFVFVLWAWHNIRVLTIPFLLLTLVTLVGSVLTGWHYAVDGYLGMGLAYICYKAALWLEQEEPAT